MKPASFTGPRKPKTSQPGTRPRSGCVRKGVSRRCAILARNTAIYRSQGLERRVRSRSLRVGVELCPLLGVATSRRKRPHWVESGRFSPQAGGLTLPGRDVGNTVFVRTGADRPPCALLSAGSRSDLRKACRYPKSLPSEADPSERRRSIESVS